MFGKSSFVYRHTDILIGIALFLLAFVPRLIGLNIFSVADEGAWLNSSFHYLDAMSRADWKEAVGFWGHPGVTTMWIGALAIITYYFPGITLQKTGFLVSGVPLTAIYHPSVELLVFARYPIALLTSLFIVAVYLVFSKTLSRRVALFAALLLVFDPFFMAMSRVFITDNLCAIFTLFSILCLGLALNSANWRWYAVSGMSAGLAFLSKSPAVFVLVPLVLILSTIVHLPQPDRLGGWRKLLARLTIWHVAMVLCIFIVWPSMWVQPLKSMQFVFGKITEVAVSGRWQREGGLLFYPVVLLFRGSPLVLVGAVATLVPLVKWPKTVPRTRISQQEIWFLSLWGTVGGFVLLFSFGIYVSDYYILPASLALVLLGAIGLIEIFESVIARWRILGGKKGLVNIGLGLVIASQTMLCVNHYPYYFSYYNPLLGGGEAAAKVIPAAVAGGEGLDQVIRYLNSRENAADLYVGINAYGVYSCVEIGDFKGELMRFPPGKRTMTKQRHWSQLDYVVYYQELAQYGSSQTFTELLALATPEFVAKTKDIECAWVYKIPKERLLTLPAEATRVDAVYENGLELVGYKTFPAKQDKGKGKYLLPVTLHWQSEHLCREDYQVVLKLRNDAYSVWASDDRFPACEGSEISWRNDLVMPDERDLKVLPGTPPGSYTLEMVVLHRPGGQEMKPDNKWAGVLGTIEIPSHPDLEVHSLDMEHEVNARLSDRVMLLGYNVSGGAQPGETLHLTLFWQALADMDDSYKVFVHVVDDQGNLLSQKDGYPVDGFYPTSLWQKDEIVRDQYRITFLDDSGATAAGLQIGMYLPATGERLPVVLSKGEMPENRAVPLP